MNNDVRLIIILPRKAACSKHRQQAAAAAYQFSFLIRMMLSCFDSLPLHEATCWPAQQLLMVQMMPMMM